MRCLDTTDGLTPSLSRMSVRLGASRHQRILKKSSCCCHKVKTNKSLKLVLQTSSTSSTGGFMSESVRLSKYSWRLDKYLCHHTDCNLSICHLIRIHLSKFLYHLFFPSVLITVCFAFVCYACFSFRMARFMRMSGTESVKDWSLKLCPWKRRERKLSLMAWREHWSTWICIVISHQS